MARNHRSLVSLSVACGLSRTTLFNAVNRERSGRLVQLEARTAEKIAYSQRLPLEWVLHGDVDDAPNSSYPPASQPFGSSYAANTSFGSTSFGNTSFGNGPASVPNTSSVLARRPGAGEAVDMSLLRSVVDTLVQHDGLSKEEASSLVGNVLFTDEAWGSSSLDLYRAVRARLEMRGRDSQRMPDSQLGAGE
ncbi:MAG: hypothetical protein ABW217_22720 [Polyangiaceae bacterium]